MKQQINEIKRMQQLAGIIKESQLNEAVKTVSFGPFTNVEWYKVGGENTITLVVTDSDKFREIENAMDFEGRDYMTDEEISYLNDKVEEIADEMSDYLTSIGIENEVSDNPIGYGQEIDNLVIDINVNDFDKLK